ncbi:MAG: hypothetical protein J4F29_18595 [Candidatus Latescibacteria bacterium]|nr:hypothetical protein [Candidatus Latescibacterota bacterium]
MGLYTPEEISNARRNIQRYAWARVERDAAINTCAPYMARSDGEIWDLITGQSIPRGIHVNPDLGCPECGRDVYAFGNYPWKVSLHRPFDVLPKLKLMDYRTCCFSRDCGINSSCLLSRRSASLTLPPPEVDAPTCEYLSLR